VCVDDAKAGDLSFLSEENNITMTSVGLYTKQVPLHIKYSLRPKM
jgi:hypothetical protein